MKEYTRGIPDYNFQVGDIRFISTMESSMRAHLYNDMQEAIQAKDYDRMRGIIADPNYDLDGVGASDKRTALHTAVYEDDAESLGILLGQTKINVNVTTTEGLTPFLYAASIGKWVSFEVLLNDSRVDIDLRDGKNLTALELITVLGEEIQVNKAKELLAKRKEDTTKLAILIVNSEYKRYKDCHQGIWDDLPGAKKDVTDMKARMEVNGYKVKVIENSPDILQDIKEEMNMTPVSSVSHLQLLYVGE